MENNNLHCNIDKLPRRLHVQKLTSRTIQLYIYLIDPTKSTELTSVNLRMKTKEVVEVTILSSERLYQQQLCNILLLFRMNYVVVSEDEAGEGIEIPVEDDGTVLLTTLCAQVHIKHFLLLMKSKLTQN